MTRRLGKVGLVAGAAWWGYRKWQEAQGEQPGDASAAATPDDEANEIIPGSTS